MRPLILSLVASAFLGLSGTASATELVVNGGFEAGTFNPTVAGYDVIAAGGTDLTGWTVGNSLAWGFGAGDINTNGGSGYVDLTGLGDNGAHGTLSQVLATTTGQLYTFSIFTAFANPNVGITVTVGGVPLVLTGTAGTYSGTTATWGQLTGVFTATSASSALTIAGQPGESFLIGLDDVSVAGPDATGVPEPATWIMMLIGFGGIGLSMRHVRRKKLATA
jgi:hypothetical protein